MIIFLDFDGVTHPVSGSQPFQLACLDALAETFNQLDADIVITSTWRLDRSIDELRTFLGSEIGDRVIGVTPDLDLDPFLKWPRVREVVAWLENNRSENEVWAAIDDEEGNYPAGYSYLSNRRTGFIETDVIPFIKYSESKRAPLLIEQLN